MTYCDFAILKMNITPIKYGSINFKKCDLLNSRLLLGIDSGSSMTKIIFLHKDNENELFDEEKDYVTLNHSLFNNLDFENAIKWVKEMAYFPQNHSYTVHITGNGAETQKVKIASMLGVNVEYIDERLTITAGHKIALERIGLEQLMSPAVEHVDDGKIESPLFDKYAEGIKSKFSTKSSDTFPCVIHVYGSLSGFFYFDENGKGEFLGCLLTGGKSFIGLAKCLLDTNDYDEIVRLASLGNRSNVDTQVKEILSDDINSPYGRFPQEMPMFPFGKCMDYNKGSESFRKEDLASSLVAHFAFEMVVACSQMCMLKKIPKVFLTGNIFRSDIFKKEISRMLAIFPFIIDFNILDFGYFGALGAMFCNNDDKAKYCNEN